MITYPDLNNALTNCGSDNQFTDLFNLEEIQRLQDLFADVNGVASIITLPDGTPITRPSKFTRFCSKIIRGTEKGCSNCYKSDQVIGRHNPAGPTIQICQSGELWDAGSGITVGGMHIANWLIGQVRNEEIDEQRMIQQALEIGANSDDFIEAYKEVPVMSVEQFSKVSNLLFEFANNLSEKAFNNLQLKSQIDDQNKTIELLRESEKKYRYLFANNPQPMWIYDIETLAFLEVNDATINQYGYSSEEFMLMTLKDIHPIEDADALLIIFDQKLPSFNPSREWRQIKKNSEIIWVEITSHSVSFNGRNARHVLVHDITKRKLAEALLQKSEEKHKELYDNAKIGMYRTTPAGAILMANKALVKLLGYSSYEKLSSRNLETDEFNQSGQRDEFLDKFENDDVVNDLESIWENQDGSKIYIRESARAIRRQDGTILYFDGVVEDITDRKKVEDALLESEIKYRAFFENSIDAILLTNADGKTLSVNQAACTMFGYSEEELIKLGREGIENALDDRLSNLIEERRLTGKAKGEVTFISKDGNRIPAEISTSRFYNHEGNERASMIIRDITERKFNEAALKLSEEQFRHSFDYAGSGVCLVGIDGKFLRINNAFKEMLGYDEDELMNLTFTDITHPKDISIGLTQLKKLLNGEIDHSTFEKRYIKKDNRIIWIYISTSLIRDVNNHKPQFFITQTIDITERKQAEKEITMLAHALKSINECVSITDLDDKIIFINESFSKTYGYDMNELIGKQIGIVRFKKNWQELDHEISKATMRGEWNGELLNKKKDGSEFPVFLSTSTIKDKDNNVLGLIGVATDITERKRAYESLLKLSSAIEQTIDTIIITDRNGTIEYVNHAFETLTGYSLKDVLGKTPRILKSGIKNKKYYEEMWTTILSGKVYRHEIVNKKKNGELYIVEKTISPIFDKNKKLTHFVGTGVDITERKVAEKELIIAKEKAEESDRLKSSFLANMSHEVRTPLNSIIGFSELLADPDYDDLQKNEFIQIIIANGNHLLTIISDIMDISKLESGEIKIHKTQINARNFISNIKEQFSFLAEAKKLELKLTIPDCHRETIFMADADRLNQIFNNLLTNAFKFTERGIVEIGYHSYGNIVEFYVNDTGIGISKEYHDKIFERFRQVETEKTRNYNGNGLGLAITKNLVELMGGKIWVESESGKGSSFYFTIPIYIRE